MNVAVDLTFQTAKSLSQNAGLEMWALGHHFNRVGPCTYRLQSRGEAETLTDAESGLTQAVEQVVANDLPHWPKVVVVKINAEETR